MTWIRNLIIAKKFNKGIARLVTLMDWCGLSKEIKFICNTFICDLIVYRAIKKKSSLVTIPLVWSLQHFFPYL
jgi:hypothetical protein